MKNIKKGIFQRKCRDFSRTNPGLVVTLLYVSASADIKNIKNYSTRKKQKKFCKILGLARNSWKVERIGICIVNF